MGDPWWRRLLPGRRRAQEVAPAGDLGAAYGAQLRVLFGGSPPRRGSAELLRAYGSLPWLHAVVRRRAEALAGVSWCVYKTKSGRRARSLRGFNAGHEARHRALGELIKDGQVERVDHPLLDLLDRPNPCMTGRAVWELASKHQDLLGENFYGVDRNRAGKPNALWPIVPTLVTRTPTADDPTYTIIAPTARRALQSDVLWIRQHDPLDPYNGRGVGTAGALGDELETDQYMAAMAKSRFYNRSTPEVILSVPGASPEAIDALAKAIEDKHRGVERAGQMHLLTKAFTAQALGHTMVEADYVEGRKLLRDFTMAVFGTPPEILGVLENANRSTIDAAEVLFARFSTVPMLERIRTELQTWVVPEFGPDTWLEYDSPVPADRDFEKSIMVALPGAFRVDEIRARAGEPPLENGEGKAMMVPPGAPGSVSVNLPQPGGPSSKATPELPAKSEPAPAPEATL